MTVRMRMTCNDEVSDEALAALREIATDPVERHPHDHQYSFMRGHLEGAVEVDPIEVHGHPLLGQLRWTIEPGRIQASVVVDLLDTLRELKAKVDRCEHYLEDDRHGSQQLNDRVNVHVPGLGLLLINELELVSDACTDAVNDKLTEGWRIVAVCPQPDQRRPDYILGRSVTP